MLNREPVLVEALSIIIPVYNSEQSLPFLVDELHKVLAELVRTYEIILVNDASRDQSWQVIKELAHQDGRVHGICLMRNYGQHNALLCGTRVAQYPIIVTMDDDLQHPPSEIHKLLRQLLNGYDVIYGIPQQEQHGLLRDMASQITKIALQSSMGVKAARNVSAFRAFRTQLREAFQFYQGSNVSIDVLLTWATTRFDAVAVRHEPRTIGVSNYTVRKLITHAMNMITGFSILPLQMASIGGFLFAGFGFLVLLFVLGRYFLQGTSVPGFPFLASVIAIFSGVQLFALGIIGEYLARMHFRLMNRPSFTIREDTSNITEYQNHLPMEN